MDAGFGVDVHIPILPEMTSCLFLFLDHLWHVPRPDGELGGELLAYLQTVSRFSEAFRTVLAGALQMESDWTTGSGAVFHAGKLA